MIKKIFNNKLPFLFYGIVLLAIILRFYLLGVNPPSLDWDEASIGYNAYSVLKTGRDEYGNFLPLSFRSFDDYKPPVYIYLTVPSVALFGLNEFAVRFPAAIVGVIAVVAVYYLVKELFEIGDRGEGIGDSSKKTKKQISNRIARPAERDLTTTQKEWIALLSAFFLAISPWHLQFSRAAFEGNVGLCFLILALYFFLRALQKNLFYVLFIFFFVLSMYSYHSFRLINPVLLLVLLFLFWKELLRKKIPVLITIAAIILLSLPIYISFVAPQGTGSRLSMVTIFSDPNLLKESAQQEIIAHQHHNILNGILYNRRVIFIPEMLKGYFDHFSFDFLFLHGDGGVQHHAYAMGMLYLWDFPFIIVGFIYLLRKLNKRIVLVPILFFLAPLPAAITSGTPHPVRAIAMIPAFHIFAAVGVVFLITKISKSKTQIPNFSYFISGVFGLFLACNVLYYLYSYYVLTPVKYGYFWQYGNKQAVEFAKNQENKYDKIIMTYAYDQPYIYYLFYNKINPVWYQSHWDYTGTGDIYRFYRKIGKYEFKNITSEDLQSQNTLLIGTPKEIPSTAHVLKEIKYLDGTVAYRVASI